jgi:hypothetical protein
VPPLSTWTRSSGSVSGGDEPVTHTTGLGLPLSRALAKAGGGWLGLEDSDATVSVGSVDSATGGMGGASGRPLGPTRSSGKPDGKLFRNKAYKRSDVSPESFQSVHDMQATGSPFALAPHVGAASPSASGSVVSAIGSGVTRFWCVIEAPTPPPLVPDINAPLSSPVSSKDVLPAPVYHCDLSFVLCSRRADF